MNGWYFAIGCLAGSAWTLAVTKRPRFPKWRPTRAKFVALTAVAPPGSQKIHAIKEIRSVTKFGLKEAKEATEGSTFTVAREDAPTLIAALRSFGVTVTSTPVRRATA